MIGRSSSQFLVAMNWVPCSPAHCSLPCTVDVAEVDAVDVAEVDAVEVADEVADDVRINVVADVVAVLDCDVVAVVVRVVCEHSL